MANVNAPFGLRPIKRFDGRFYGTANTYPLASGTSGNIGRGDAVKKTGSGNYITVGTNGTAPVIGVFVGVRYRASDGSVFYRPNWVSGTTTFNSEDAQALVLDDPSLVFLVQANSTGVAAADIGQFAGLTFGTPDANGNSTSVLDGADITGTADNLKILRLSDLPIAGRDPIAYGAYAVVEAMFGIHELRGNPQAT